MRSRRIAAKGIATMSLMTMKPNYSPNDCVEEDQYTDLPTVKTRTYTQQHKSRKT